MNNDDVIRQVPSAAIEDWIVEHIAGLVNIAPESVSRDADFESFGIDSAKAISLVVDLENWLNLPEELPLELLFEAGSIAHAAENIAATVTQMADAQ